MSKSTTKVTKVTKTAGQTTVDEIKLPTLNPNAILDQLASTMMMSQMMKMGDQSQGLTMQSVLSMLILFSVNELKELARYTLKQTQELIKAHRSRVGEYIVFLWGYLIIGLTTLYHSCKAVFVSGDSDYGLEESDDETETEEEESDEDDIEEGMVAFNMEITNPILELLIQHGKTQKQKMSVRPEIGLQFTSLDQSVMKLKYDGFDFLVDGLGQVNCRSTMDITYKNLRGSEEFAFQVDEEEEKRKEEEKKEKEKNVGTPWPTTRAKDLFDLCPDKQYAEDLRTIYQEFARLHPAPLNKTVGGNYWNHITNSGRTFARRRLSGEIYIACLLYDLELFAPKTSETLKLVCNQVTLVLAFFRLAKKYSRSSRLANHINNQIENGLLVFPELDIKITLSPERVAIARKCRTSFSGATWSFPNMNDPMNKLTTQFNKDCVARITKKITKYANKNPNIILKKKVAPKIPVKKQLLRVIVKPEETELSNDELAFRFRRFLIELIEAKKKDTKRKNNIYLLKLQYDIKTEEEENPEYKKYQEESLELKSRIKKMKKAVDKKKQELRKQKQKERDEKKKKRQRQKEREENGESDEESESESESESEGETESGEEVETEEEINPFVALAEAKKELKALVEPEQKLKKETKTMKIVKKKIRSFKKPLDTLYLREEDTQCLHSILEAYSKRDEVFERLGIPKKLGILAHGLPGTGKTTTIQAIATALKLDIYYLDLNGITKNEELKKMFDYVMTQNLGGGMIVFEDIDAMTNVVHKRTNSEEFSNTMAELDEDDLSLSYLLNMLDGTLCAENTVYAITTNHKEKLDPALYRKGRIDVDIDFKLCDRYQCQNIYKQMMEREIPSELLSRIKEDSFTPADFIFRTLEYLYTPRIPDETILSPFLEKHDIFVTGTDGSQEQDIDSLTPEEVMDQIMAEENEFLEITESDCSYEVESIDGVEDVEETGRIDETQEKESGPESVFFRLPTPLLAIEDRAMPCDTPKSKPVVLSNPCELGVEEL